MSSKLLPRTPAVRVVLLGLSIAALASCGGGDTSGPPDDPNAVPVASVAVAPPSSSVAVGAEVQFTATAKDGNGQVLSGRPVTWSSNNPGVAQVSPTGRVTGVAAGQATITATIEGKTGTATVTVGSAVGMVRVWLGGASGKAQDWSTAENWLPVGVPTAADTVGVPAVAQPAVLAVDAQIAFLKVAGGRVRIAGHRLVVHP